jgi:hypothetical protein
MSYSRTHIGGTFFEGRYRWFGALYIVYAIGAWLFMVFVFVMQLLAIPPMITHGPGWPFEPGAVPILYLLARSAEYETTRQALSVIVSPLPMLFVGLAFLRRRKWAIWPAFGLAVIEIVCVLELHSRSVPVWQLKSLDYTIWLICAPQHFFAPGALALGFALAFACLTANSAKRVHKGHQPDTRGRVLDSRGIPARRHESENNMNNALELTANESKSAKPICPKQS